MSGAACARTRKTLLGQDFQKTRNLCQLETARSRDSSSFSVQEVGKKDAVLETALRENWRLVGNFLLLS